MWYNKSHFLARKFLGMFFTISSSTGTLTFLFYTLSSSLLAGLIAEIVKLGQLVGTI